jgi:hypothetical protein
MGELVKRTAIGQWLDRIDATRNELIASTQSGNRTAAAFAMADARVELIESLKDEAIRAKLLRMTDPEIAMVELANNPSHDDRIRICAIAILSGFTPGDDQFAVFGGGKNPGKLYVKERGFRTLFSHLGIVPEVQTGHPEFVPLGTSGKKIWRVSGTASCTYLGKEYSVECDGEQSIGIPGYDTDNVAGIAAKARRRLLQSLWVKVSPIFSNDQHDEDDQDTIPVSQVEVSRPMLTQDPGPTKAETFAEQWRAELTGLGKPAAKVAAEMFAAWKQSDVDAVSKILTEDVPKVSKDDNRIFQKLSRFANAIDAYIKEESK